MKGRDGVRSSFDELSSSRTFAGLLDQFSNWQGGLSRVVLDYGAIRF
jgi:hypothetical protein